MLRNAEACANERALTEGVDCGGATTERERARAAKAGRRQRLLCNVCMKKSSEPYEATEGAFPSQKQYKNAGIP